MRLALLAVAGALLWLYRRSFVADVGLKVPARWPACVPDSGAASRAPPPRRRGVDGARLVVVSTWLPTRCGIATYSAGLRGGLLATGASVDVVALHLRSDEEHAYGPEARGCGSSAPAGPEQRRRLFSPYAKTSQTTTCLPRTTLYSRRALTVSACCAARN